MSTEFDSIDPFWCFPSGSRKMSRNFYCSCALLNPSKKWIICGGSTVWYFQLRIFISELNFREITNGSIRLWNTPSSHFSFQFHGKKNLNVSEVLECLDFGPDCHDKSTTILTIFPKRSWGNNKNPNGEIELIEWMCPLASIWPFLIYASRLAWADLSFSMGLSNDTVTR